jgi:hypothetical protein
MGFPDLTGLKADDVAMDQCQREDHAQREEHAQLVRGRLSMFLFALSRYHACPYLLHSWIMLILSGVSTQFSAREKNLPERM